ncbi:uncharacterized protein METZ01_LOCUS491977 [marine metagenome]|uniref:Uncharacterized protein n=1 Tax=marine metagenome TaxID=408172 RepID=A0A383D4D4_9ZZZZ
MAKPMISEVLKKAGELKTKKEKIEYLRANNSLPLRAILKGSFDSSVEFNLPKGEPPYRKDDAPKGFEPSNLYKISRRFKYFDKGGIGDGMSSTRREKMFIDCLESLHPDEAQLLIDMKDKKLGGKYNGITPKLISEIWPTLLVEPQSHHRKKATPK